MAKEPNSSTGLVLHGSYVEWTSLRRRKGRPEVSAHEKADADLPDPVDYEQDEQANKLYKVCGSIRGDLSIGLPSGLALIRVVDLPTSDPEELAGAVELQVDKFAPFQMDRLQIAWEVLAKQEQGARVLIAAVLRDHIERLGHPFLLHRHCPDRVDVEVLGWWRLLRDHGDVQEVGRQVFLLLEPGGTELIISQDGQPVVLRTLGGHEDVHDDEFIAEIAEETHYTLASLESEWGAMHTGRIYLWHWGEVPGPMRDKLIEECSLEVESRRFEDLPPLSEGLARRLADPKPGLNLRPDEWFAMARSRATKKRLLAAAGVLLALWAAAMVVLIGLNRLEGPRYRERLARVEALEEEAALVRALQDRLDELERYADRTYSSLECLRETSLLLPGGVEMTSFSYKKGEGVDLRGQAPSADPVYDYIEALERSDLFAAITPDDIRSRMRQGSRITEFKIEAALPGAAE